MSVRITPESPPPEEKFSHGMIRVIPLESFGDGARDPRRLPKRSVLCLRVCYRMDCRRLIEFGSVRSVFQSLGNGGQLLIRKDQRSFLNLGLILTLIRRILWVSVSVISDF